MIEVYVWRDMAWVGEVMHGLLKQSERRKVIFILMGKLLAGYGMR